VYVWPVKYFIAPSFQAISFPGLAEGEGGQGKKRLATNSRVERLKKNEPEEKDVFSLDSVLVGSLGRRKKRYFGGKEISSAR